MAVALELFPWHFGDDIRLDEVGDWSVRMVIGVLSLPCFCWIHLDIYFFLLQKVHSKMDCWLPSLIVSGKVLAHGAAAAAVPPWDPAPHGLEVKEPDSTWG